VSIAEAPMSARAHAQILWAGPIAEGLFALTLLLCGSLLALPAPLPLGLVLFGVGGLFGAVSNLVPDKRGRNDGAQLRRLRRPPPPALASEPSRPGSVPPPSASRRPDT
jgi:hypothetical protein